MNALALHRNRIRGIDTQHRGDLGIAYKRGIQGGFHRSLMRRGNNKLHYRYIVKGRIELLSILGERQMGNPGSNIIVSLQITFYSLMRLFVPS